MKNFTIKMKQLFDKKLHMKLLLIKKQICRMLFRMIFVVLPLAAAMTAFMQLFTLVRGADFERYAQRRLGDARFYVTSERHHRLYEDYDISLKLKPLEQRLDGLVTFSQIGCAEYWIDFHDEKNSDIK